MQSTMSHRCWSFALASCLCLLTASCVRGAAPPTSFVTFTLSSTIFRTSLQIRLFLALKMVPLKLKEVTKVTNKVLSQFNTGSTAFRCVQSSWRWLHRYLNVLSASGKGLVSLPLRVRKKPTDKNRNARQTPQMCVQCRRKADVALAPLGSAITPAPSWQRAKAAAAVKFPQFPPVPLPFKPFLMSDPCSRILTATALAHPQRVRV